MRSTRQRPVRAAEPAAQTRTEEYDSDLGENNDIPEEGDRICIDTPIIDVKNADVTSVKKVPERACIPPCRIVTSCASQVPSSGYHPVDKDGNPVYIICFKVKKGGELLQQT